MLLMILYAALIALFSVVYRHILAYEDILNWWFVFGARFEDKWFYKPIWGCELCISGQIALWSYLINCIIHGYFNQIPRTCNALSYFVPLYSWQNYNLLEGLIFVCTTIAAAFIIFKGFRKIKD